LAATRWRGTTRAAVPPRTHVILVPLLSLATSALFAISIAWADKPHVIVFPGNDAAAYRHDSGVISRIAPDPPSLTSRMQWVFDLRWSNSEPYLVAIHPLDLGEPQTTPRVMGRFAIELFEGPTLIERVRFDFPMLGPPEPDAGWGAPPSLTRSRHASASCFRRWSAERASSSGIARPTRDGRSRGQWKRRLATRAAARAERRRRRESARGWRDWIDRLRRPSNGTIKRFRATLATR
jgi:hypothetical protein